MRRMLSLSALAVAALLSRSAVAEDPKTYTLPVHETWKVGDVASRAESDHKVNKQIVKTADGNVVKNEATDEVLEYHAVMKVLEVDDAGRFTKALMYFSKWSRKTGEAEDKCLEGKHAEITVSGGVKSVKVLTPGADISPDAAKWLDDEMGKGSHSDQADEAFTPKKPVAVGESWSPELSVLQKMFGEKMTFVADKSTVKITLTGVEGDVASLAVDFDLQAGPMDTPQGKLEWKEGGKMTMKAEGKKPLKAGVHAGGGKMNLTFGGVINAGPATVELVTTVENSSEVGDGGEMPPAPEAK